MCRQAESLVQAAAMPLLQAEGRAEAVQRGADAELYKVGTGSIWGVTGTAVTCSRLRSKQLEQPLPLY